MTDFNHGRVNETEAKLVKLDLRDKKLLVMLSEDGRMPLSVAAKKIRVSRDTVDYRIKRLAKNGIILGFMPQINLGYFGYNTYHVFMVVNTLNEQRKKELIDELISHPNTRSVMEYHDSWDFEWVLVARTLKEFDEAVSEVTSKFSDIITRKDKLTIIKGYKSVQLPGALYKESAHHAKKPRRRKEKARIDRTDMEILRVLSEDSRQSTYDISRKLGISADAVGYRIKKLISSGVIYGFTALINLSAINYHLHTFCINVKTFDLKTEARFKEFVAGNPNILRAVKVLGDWDLLIYLTTESQESFHRTFKETQETLGEAMMDHQTWAAYMEHAYHNLPKAVVSLVGGEK